MWLFVQEEFEIAYEAAKAAGIEPNGVADVDMNDPNKITVVRWIMDNAHCGWLIGKGGSGIQNIEVRACVVFVSSRANRLTNDNSSASAGKNSTLPYRSRKF